MVANLLLTGLSVVIVAALLPGMKVERYRDAVFFAVVVGLHDSNTAPVLSEHTRGASDERCGGA
jgi:uncharacterized membrane protein YvlD (DUF360 family)